MKSSLAILLALLLTIACYGEASSTIAGVYRGSSGVEVRTITLMANGTYLAKWDADIGSNGTATGTWQLIGKEVRLTPKKEEGPMMQGAFRVLLLREFEGKRALLPKEDEKYSDNPYFHLLLQEEKKPNKPLVTTAMTQTPSATVTAPLSHL